MKSILWWGRSDTEYSRNRIVRALLRGLGIHVIDFPPRVSMLADFEARFSLRASPDLIWVPCFRQRDLPSALRYGRRHGIPVLADPLISSWEKQVFERKKFDAGSWRSRRLLSWEARLLGGCDMVLADTPQHLEFMIDHLGVDRDRARVLWVGAEEELFFASPAPLNLEPEALFWGSFIGLHGVETIVEAAQRCQRPNVRWTLIGHGSEHTVVKTLAKDSHNVCFEPPVPYLELARRISRADIVLGVFGESEKAGRVIPNKVFQGLAIGRPVVTREALPFEGELPGPESGIFQIPPGDPGALSRAVGELAANRKLLKKSGEAARRTYERNFGAAVIRQQLAGALAELRVLT